MTMLWKLVHCFSCASIELRMPLGAIATPMTNEKMASIVQRQWSTKKHNRKSIYPTKKFLEVQKLKNKTSPWKQNVQLSVSLFPTNLTIPRSVAISGVTMVLNWLVPDLAAHIRSDNRHKLKWRTIMESILPIQEPHPFIRGAHIPVQPHGRTPQGMVKSLWHPWTQSDQLFESLSLVSDIEVQRLVQQLVLHFHRFLLRHTSI